MARLPLKERRKQQEAISKKRNRSRAWNKANPRPVNKGNAAAYNEAMRVWKAKKKAFKNPTPQTPKDKAEAKREAELESLLKNKPKGGYSKDTSPKTKPKTKAKNTDKLQTDYVDPDAADKKAEKVYRSSSSVKEAKEKHAKIEKSKIKGKGPVKDAKEYEKTVKEHAAKKEAKDRKDWLDKTRNSPAARSGAFTDKERWEQQKKHRQWKEDRKSGKLKKERKKKKKLRIASPMDMD